MIQRGFYDRLSCATRPIFGFLPRSDGAFHLSAVTPPGGVFVCAGSTGLWRRSPSWKTAPKSRPSTQRPTYFSRKCPEVQKATSSGRSTSPRWWETQTWPLFNFQVTALLIVDFIFKSIVYWYLVFYVLCRRWWRSSRMLSLPTWCPPTWGRWGSDSSPPARWESCCGVTRTTCSHPSKNFSLSWTTCLGSSTRSQSGGCVGVSMCSRGLRRVLGLTLRPCWVSLTEQRFQRRSVHLLHRGTKLPGLCQSGYVERRKVT